MFLVSLFCGGVGVGVAAYVSLETGITKSSWKLFSDSTSSTLNKPEAGVQGVRVSGFRILEFRV